MMAKYTDCIIFLLAKAHQEAQSIFKRKLKPYGLTTVQHLILEALFRQDGRTAGDLVKNLTLDHATLSGVLDRMAEAGWITKEQDDSDKRYLRVHLTGKAEGVREQLVIERINANEEILENLNTEEKVLFKRFLRDLQPNQNAAP